MKLNLDQCLQQRQTLLAEMQTIDRLRRGTLSQQFFPARSGSAAKRGPYFVLQGFFRGKKFSQRVPAAEAGQVQHDVDNYRRFQTLAEEYVTLSDQIARLQDASHDSKKNSRPRKLPPRGSAKPPPS
ncbi:MAG: DUF6788 family protein [Gammaproteobacteria bacterium]